MTCAERPNVSVSKDMCTPADGAATARGARVHGQTLFGLNVPSLQALDQSESALHARPAIIGT